MYASYQSRPRSVIGRWISVGSKPQLALVLVSVVFALAGALAVTGVLTASKSIGSSGSVKAINVDVYSDSACTLVLSSIDWGTIEAGTSVNRTIYVKNTGNHVLTLSLSSSGWSPSDAGSYLTLSWDKQGATLNKGQSTAAVLTLAVSSSISGITSFSVNIVIQGTG